MMNSPEYELSICLFNNYASCNKNDDEFIR